MALNDDFYEFDDDTRADIEWLKKRMTEMMAFLQAMPGYEQPHPQFRERFGEMPLTTN